MADKYIVSALDTNDYEPAATFLEKATRGVFKKELWLDRFECWWEKNPFMDENIPKGWIIRGKDEEIGGFLGNIPVKYYINGQEEIACSITSWYIDEKYKDRSLDLLIPYLKQKSPAILLDTTPIEKIERMFCKLGFISLKKEWLKEDAFYPVNIIDFLDFLIERIASNKIKVNLLKLAGLILIPVIKLYQMVHLPQSDGRYTFKEIKRFSEEFAPLWSKLKGKYRVIALRDATALNWFIFGTNKLLLSRKVIELRFEDEIIGYVAAKEVGYNLNGGTYYFLEVVDMVILSNEAPAHDIALKGLLWLSENSENKIIFILINPFVDNIRHALLRHGFFIKRGKSRFLYRQTEGHVSDLHASLDESYYATPLDGDRCFFP